MAGAGDVNGDGKDDVIVGAADAGNNSRTNSGSSYVIYGSATPTNVDLASLSSTQGFRIDGAAANDSSGPSVAGAGDVNGDGKDDVIVGAQVPTTTAADNSGSSYVIYGSATPANVDLASLSSAQGFRIDGAAANDAERLLGGRRRRRQRRRQGRRDRRRPKCRQQQPRQLRLLLRDLRLGNANQRRPGEPRARARAFESTARRRTTGAATRSPAHGDVNGDGTDDVIVGAPDAGNNGRFESGSSYVIYGSSTPANIDLASLSSSQGFRIDGAEDESGVSVAGAGDVNSDGRDDVIVGEPDASRNSRDFSGSSYVIYGQATPTNIDLASLSSSQGFRIDGAASFDGSGSAVAGAGDFNGDGRDDVIVGAPNAANNSRNASGSSYLVYGPPKPDLSTAASTATTVGRPVHDSATLVGGQSPTGTIDFELYGPGDAACSKAPVFSDSETVDSGDGDYKSATFKPRAAGTYRWVASYSGDDENQGAAGACNDAGEAVKVAPDTTPPQTKIKRVPENPGRHISVFVLKSSEPGSSFECSLDRKRFRACGRKTVYHNLKPGEHVFRARATDKAGNTDASPAKASFRVRKPPHHH